MPGQVKSVSTCFCIINLFELLLLEKTDDRVGEIDDSVAIVICLLIILVSPA